MRRTHLHACTALLALALAGCADNRTSVVITQLCYPPTPADGVCEYTATCGAHLASGRLAAALGSTPGKSLVFPLEILNQMEANASDLQTNTRDYYIQWFDMRYEAAGVSIPNARSLQSFKVPAGGSIQAVAFLIPPGSDASNAFTGTTEVTIWVKAHGYLGDNSTFETAEFPVPATIVSGAVPAGTCADPTQTYNCCPQDGQTAVCQCQ